MYLHSTRIPFRQLFYVTLCSLTDSDGVTRTTMGSRLMERNCFPHSLYSHPSEPWGYERAIYCCENCRVIVWGLGALYMRFNTGSPWFISLVMIFQFKSKYMILSGAQQLSTDTMIQLQTGPPLLPRSLAHWANEAGGVFWTKLSFPVLCLGEGN